MQNREEKQQFYNEHLGKLEHIKDIKIDFILNDDSEVLFRIRPKRMVNDTGPRRNSDDLISIPSESNIFREN